MNLAAFILAAVSLFVAGVALGLAIVQRRRPEAPRPSLEEQLMGMTTKDFDKFKEKPEDYGFHRLETILTEMKKALAVTQQESGRHAKERPKIAYGERSTYTIQSLEVSLKGRIAHIPDPTPATSDIRFSFAGRPEEMSELRFTVSTVPPRRTVPGAGIFFALDPKRFTSELDVIIRQDQPLKSTLIACDENGNFLYNHRIDVALYRCAGGGQGHNADVLQGQTQQLYTNSRGQVEVSFDKPPDQPGTYRIHAILWTADGKTELKADNYYFEAVEPPKDS
ncbi:hypothetical protein FJZ31_16455 [Candidatus Poribacteria bacterium]|nr:hypothetical protein [Candidatus Poribacteria bacterium]